MGPEPRPGSCLVSEARKVARKIPWAEAVKGLLGWRKKHLARDFEESLVS